MVLIKLNPPTSTTTGNYGATKETSTIPTTFADSSRSTLRSKSESDVNHDLNVPNDPETTLKKQLKYDPKSGSKFTTRQILILISLSLFNFTSFCCLSILAPFFPKEAQNKGVTLTVIGLIFSVYAFIIFVASPFMGYVVAKVGPRCVFMTGVLLTGACSVLFGLLYMIESTGAFIFFCFAVRSLEALGAAAFLTAGSAFIAEVFPDHMSRIWGILEIFVGLGMSVGPAIGGILYDWGGYGLPFYAVGGFMLLMLPLNFFLLPFHKLDGSEVASPGRQLSMWKLLKIPPITFVVLTVIVASNTWAFLDPTLEPHLRQFGFSATQLGGIFMLISVMYGLSSPFWGSISARLKHSWIFFVIGMLFASLGLFLLGPSPLIDLDNMIWLNMVALIILGLFIAMALLPTFEAMLDFALDAGYRDDVSTYGLIAGLWSSVYSLGEVLGQGLGSVLTEKFGFPVTSTIMAFLCFLIAILVLVYFLFIYKKPTKAKILDLDIDEQMPILQPYSSSAIQEKEC